MNAPLTPPVSDAIRRTLENRFLEDKYTLERGRIYISGTQALVRLPMLQQRARSRRGSEHCRFHLRLSRSPLGALDQSLWKAKKHLDAHDVVFQAGLNEDLAATAVWGSQQVNTVSGRQVRRRVRHVVRQGPGRGPHRRRLQARQLRRL